MRVPLVTPHAPPARRKGGGGGGGGRAGGGGGKSGGGGGKSSSGSKGSSGSASKKSSVPISGLPTTSKSSSATAYGSGGGRPIIITTGPFTNRTTGGGTRSQIYGTSSYGSGYPGDPFDRSVRGKGFPFWFWPIVWSAGVGVGAGVGALAYLDEADEYGSPTNLSRPGGAMVQALFQSNSSAPVTFHIVADNATVVSLISSIRTNCSSTLSNGTTSTVPATYTGASTDPQPEQAVQYYRASSMVLTLDGYNNSATFSSDVNASATALPTGIDTTLLGCLNSTIGQAVPLVDGGVRFGPHSVGIVGLFWIVFLVAKTMV